MNYLKEVRKKGITKYCGRQYNRSVRITLCEALGYVKFEGP